MTFKLIILSLVYFATLINGVTPLEHGILFCIAALLMSIDIETEDEEGE